MLFWHSAVLLFNNVYSVPLLIVGKGVKVISEVIGVVFIFDLIDVYDQIVNHQSSLSSFLNFHGVPANSLSNE